MHLISRLERLEDRFDIRSCPACGGHGPFVISHVLEDDPAPAVQGCPVCGDAVHIVMRFRTRPLPDERVVQSDLNGEEVGKLLA